MRVYFGNDSNPTLVPAPGPSHAGVIAACDSVKRIIREHHEIVGTWHRGEQPDEAILESCDALIINGEGTMRDEARPHEPGRIDLLLGTLDRAIGMGKMAYLVNTVWCRMTARWGALLRNLNEVSVREPSSALEMQMANGVYPTIYPDAAYFLPIDESAPMVDFGGRVVVGHLYPHNFAERLTEEHPNFSRWPDRLPLMPPPAPSWSSIVRSLRTASVYFTGQHHGVIAACRARVPFIPLTVNTHKVSGLLAWANARVPMIGDSRQIAPALKWAQSNWSAYDDLFAFLERQAHWPGP
jgi:hypothetical protein